MYAWLLLFFFFRGNDIVDALCTKENNMLICFEFRVDNTVTVSQSQLCTMKQQLKKLTNHRNTA